MIRTFFVALLTIFVFVPTTQAQEAFESTACYSGEMTMLHSSEQLTVMSFETKGTVRSNTNSEIFNNVSEMVIGVWCKEGDKITQRGFAKYLDLNGDVIIMEWDGKSNDGTWKLLLGTGKWEGIKGSGTWNMIQRLKPIAPATFQHIRVFKGTYELPK